MVIEFGNSFLNGRGAIRIGALWSRPTRIAGTIVEKDSDWRRNFLLFLPTNTQTPLKAVLSYYSSAVSLNAEGDTSIREDTLEGLGRPQVSYLTVLFGAIINIANSPPIPLPSEFPASSTGAEEEGSNMHEFNQAPFVEGMYIPAQLAHSL